MGYLSLFTALFAGFADLAPSAVGCFQFLDKREDLGVLLGPQILQDFAGAPLLTYFFSSWLSFLVAPCFKQNAADSNRRACIIRCRLLDVCLSCLIV